MRPSGVSNRRGVVWIRRFDGVQHRLGLDIVACFSVDVASQEAEADVGRVAAEGFFERGEGGGVVASGAVRLDFEAIPGLGVIGAVVQFGGERPRTLLVLA